MERKTRALIFDDNRDLSHLLEVFLKNKGYDVFTYEDPSLCPLQHSHECRCGKNQACTDIVITDIDMPNISGIDFIEDQIRKGCKVQNIAIMSGKWSEVNMKRAKDLGCAVFEKPFALSAIRKWIDECEEQKDPCKEISNWFLHNHNRLIPAE